MWGILSGAAIRLVESTVGNSLAVDARQLTKIIVIQHHIGIFKPYEECMLTGKREERVVAAKFDFGGAMGFISVNQLGVLPVASEK